MFPLLIAAALAAADLPHAAAPLPTAVYAHNDVGAQLVGLTLVVRAGTARQGPTQNGLAALSAQTLLLSSIDGRTLTDRITAAGGSVDFTVDPGVVRFSIEMLPEAVPAVTADIARAVASPDVSPATVAAARAALGARIDDNEGNPISVGVEMLHTSYYRGSAGAPALGSRASLQNLAPADVRAFIGAHYVRGDAFATATGRIDDAARAAAGAVLAAFPGGSEAPPVVAAQGFPAQPKHLVTQREIGVPFALVGFAAPAMTDKDFGAMLVLRALLDDVAARQSSTTLALYERGIDVVYAYDVKPATFTVAINGSQVDPSAGLTVLQAILKTAVSKPFGRDVIKRYKETAHGDWALEAITLSDRGWQMAAALNQGADPATQDVDAAIERVTSADVQRLAKTYLQRYAVAIVLPRRRT
jgi:predicted Zn-dependent peptidase